jgi:hypothetical protein
VTRNLVTLEIRVTLYEDLLDQELGERSKERKL